MGKHNDPDNISALIRKDREEKREARKNAIHYKRKCLGGCKRIVKTTNKHERVCCWCRARISKLGRFPGGANIGRV